ncbi:MAG: hypothetical protein J3R72DRAFT_429630 [Linnemannia gamsii]|nr:MAG: hypothetical protein J3R72DRAFT_429630 [Linnemannia gamsii]
MCTKRLQRNWLFLLQRHSGTKRSSSQSHGEGELTCLIIIHIARSFYSCGCLSIHPIQCTGAVRVSEGGKWLFLCLALGGNWVHINPHTFLCCHGIPTFPFFFFLFLVLPHVPPFSLVTIVLQSSHEMAWPIITRPNSFLFFCFSLVKSTNNTRTKK